MLDNQGQMITVEAFLAVLLIFSAMALTTMISPASNFSDDISLESVGMQVLVAIDNDGHLGALVDERNWSALAHSLDTLLSVGVSYNLTVYDQNSQLINTIAISNGMISDRNVVSIQYPCASPNAQSNCYLLRLQLAKAR